MSLNIMLINVKMPIVDILTLISTINFMLICIKHVKSFITLMPGLSVLIMRVNMVPLINMHTYVYGEV